jgi:hypothetical protein
MRIKRKNKYARSRHVSRTVISALLSSPTPRHTLDRWKSIESFAVEKELMIAYYWFCVADRRSCEEEAMSWMVGIGRLKNKKKKVSDNLAVHNEFLRGCGTVLFKRFQKGSQKKPTP